MKLKKVAVILVVICMVFSLTACGKKCANGCGEAADPECWADMCDDCCDFYCGLNGCRENH